MAAALERGRRLSHQLPRIIRSHDVRALLREHGIGFHETPPSVFGISAGGIWLGDVAAYPHARALLDDYQRQRAEAARAQRQQALEDGSGHTFASLLRARPLFVIGTLLAMLAAAALVLLPFVLLSR